MNNKKPKVKGIGLIVEDDSDFNSYKKLISRTVKVNNLTFKKANGKGCGKLRRKLIAYATNLHRRKCDMIIVFHDLDRNDLEELSRNLKKLISKSPAPFNYVCIPIEEIEAWFLSDPDIIKEVFKLPKRPNISNLPETIFDPKGKLEDIVYLGSNKRRMYLNTKDNEKLSEKVSIEKMKNKCNSFNELYNYLKEYDFK